MFKFASKILDSAKTYNINKISKELKNFVPEYKPEKNQFNRAYKKTIFSEK